MTKVLITGMGGTGKSAVCDALIERGFQAFDADKVAGLARWEDKKTHQPISVDHTKFVDYTKVDWAWSKTVLQQLLNTEGTIFVCGSASNSWDFFDEFDAVGVLTLPESTHRHRLETRSSSYGKDPQTIQWILDTQPKVVQYATDLGAVTIDASGTIDATVKQAIRLAGHEN